MLQAGVTGAQSAGTQEAFTMEMSFPRAGPTARNTCPGKSSEALLPAVLSHHRQTSALLPTWLRLRVLAPLPTPSAMPSQRPEVEAHRAEIEQRTHEGANCEQIARELTAKGFEVSAKSISRYRLQWGLRKRRAGTVGR